MLNASCCFFIVVIIVVYSLENKKKGHFTFNPSITLKLFSHSKTNFESVKLPKTNKQTNKKAADR